jgi:hypothetical protein
MEACKVLPKAFSLRQPSIANSGGKQQKAYAFSKILLCDYSE